MGRGNARREILGGFGATQGGKFLVGSGQRNKGNTQMVGDNAPSTVNINCKTISKRGS